MKRPAYRDAVQWIAENDETGEDDWMSLAELISVVMVSDLFDVTGEKVAKDVLRYRQKAFA